MGICSICTYKYEADIGRLLQRRINGLGGGLDVAYRKDGAEAEISSPVQLEQWCAAAAELLLLDISQLYIADMVSELPLDMEEKRAILPEVIVMARQGAGIERVQRELYDYFTDNDSLILEGYADFRMDSDKREWQRIVYRAADELLIDSEYTELMRLLAAFIQMRAPRLHEVYVILNPDGSCTFTDENDVRIDYERCTGEGIMSVLVGLAPEKITVYDLSGGRSAALFRDLMRVFDGKVSFFK